MNIISLVLEALICNVFLALFGSYLWVTSIVYSSLENYAFEARKFIAFCDGLSICTVIFVKAGIFFALFLNLYPNWPEIVIVMALAAGINHYGTRTLGELQLSILPLEIFHFPNWVKALALPSTVFKHRDRVALEKRAKTRAKYLKTKAYHERKLRGPNNFDSNASSISQANNTSIGTLIRTAAINLGRSEYDVSAFEAKLEEDWYNEADQLKEEDVDALARYMPRLLAKEVHKIIATKSFHSSRRNTAH